ncbi:hypothetical protein [Streptomyces sp. AC550_RSS872]|uniref:hypothetical protein n=1 Tax=Streptomyces sp. AC550_RSS872 TaxID=2823689 RepID=UPI001C2520E3|nr:hypothetical protein [Streptomyces sp. AC550_RSS872]
MANVTPQLKAFLDRKGLILIDGKDGSGGPTVDVYREADRDRAPLGAIGRAIPWGPPGYWKAFAIAADSVYPSLDDLDGVHPTLDATVYAIVGYAT